MNIETSDSTKNIDINFETSLTTWKHHQRLGIIDINSYVFKLIMMFLSEYQCFQAIFTSELIQDNK